MGGYIINRTLHDRFVSPHGHVICSIYQLFTEVEVNSSIISFCYIVFSRGVRETNVGGFNCYFLSLREHIPRNPPKRNYSAVFKTGSGQFFGCLSPTSLFQTLQFPETTTVSFYPITAI